MFVWKIKIYILYQSLATQGKGLALKGLNSFVIYRNVTLHSKLKNTDNSSSMITLFAKRVSNRRIFIIQVIFKFINYLTLLAQKGGGGADLFPF